MQHRPDRGPNPAIATPAMVASCFKNEPCSDFRPTEVVSRAGHVRTETILAKAVAGITIEVTPKARRAGL
jgi:hypothetical protein